jgi:hypothetical protein
MSEAVKKLILRTAGAAENGSVLLTLSLFSSLAG